MKLSIITINYNNCEGLRRTIESVVAQTCSDFEYIVIDGGSTDDSVDVIKQYAQQIDYWVSEPDKGIYNAMNKGVAQAHGEYCLFMNSGDCLNDEAVVEDVYSIGLKSDVVTGGIKKDGGNVYFGPERVSMRHFYRKTLFHQASFIKTDVLREIPYDESYEIAADWKFFIDALVVNGHTYSPIARVVGIMEPDGKGANQEIHTKECQRMLQSVLPKYVFADYDAFLDGESDYDKFYMCVKNSRFRGMLYVLNCIIVKICNIGRKDNWTKSFSIRNKA